MYDKLPFGKYHKGTPLIIDLAQRMGRTPSSLAMKLTNLASLDPYHRARGVKAGRCLARRPSHLDRIPRATHRTGDGRRGALRAVLQRWRGDHRRPRTQAELVVRTHWPLGEVLPVKVRIGQRYFRQIVLNAYGGRCALTGMGIRSMLVASHIIPWSQAEQHRLDPQNGIALNALHDKAFDRGLITFDTELRLVCATSLREHFAHATVAQNFQANEGKPLTLPAEAAGPKPEYLQWHREHLFGR